MFIFLLSIADAVVVPIIPSESNSIRVFCLTDKPNDVSFSPDKKCESSCGYYEGQNTCCKVWVFTEDTVVRCYQNGQTRRTLEFSATIIPSLSKQTVTNKTQSELICLNAVGKNQFNHITQRSLYMKFAYLYDGTPKHFDQFFNLKSIKLPADESEVECNNTKYAFHILPAPTLPDPRPTLSSPSPSLSEIYQRIEIMMILVIGLILGVIFYLIYTHWAKLVAVGTFFYKRGRFDEVFNHVSSSDYVNDRPR